MSTDEIRVKVDDIVQRLIDDSDFRAQMDSDPEGALVSAGLGEEAAVILAEDWQGATSAAGGAAALAPCEIRKSCRFTESTDPCGPTATTLRCPSARCAM